MLFIGDAAASNAADTLIMSGMRRRPAHVTRYFISSETDKTESCMQRAAVTNKAGLYCSVLYFTVLYREGR